MKRTKGFLLYFFLMLFVVASGLVFSDIKANASSDSDAASKIGEFKTIKGDAELVRAGKNIAVKEGESFKLLDIAVTAANSETLILLKNESLIVLGGPPKSKLSLKEYSLSEKEGVKSVLALPYGEMRAMTCATDRFAIETPLAKVDAFGTLDFAIWESTADGKPVSCLAVLKEGVVEIKNNDASVKGTVRVPKGEMSCVTAGGVPSAPVTIPNELLNALTAKGNRAYTDNACKKPCTECETLNEKGICVPDNFKPCDDGDSCTIDDRCTGGQCKGKKDPSPVDPNCL